MLESLFIPLIPLFLPCESSAGWRYDIIEILLLSFDWWGLCDTEFNDQ